jgi:hypothetical protein
MATRRIFARWSGPNLVEAVSLDEDAEGSHCLASTTKTSNAVRLRKMNRTL